MEVHERKKQTSKHLYLPRIRKIKYRIEKIYKKQGQAVRKVLMAPLLAALLAFIVTNI